MAVCNEEYLEWVKGMSDIDLSDFVAQAVCLLPVTQSC
jgi:hypothetical protein